MERRAMPTMAPPKTNAKAIRLMERELIVVGQSESNLPEDKGGLGGAGIVKSNSVWDEN